MKDKLKVFYYWCICLSVFVCNTLTGEGGGYRAQTNIASMLKRISHSSWFVSPWLSGVLFLMLFLVSSQILHTISNMDIIHLLPSVFASLKSVQNSSHCCRWASTTGTKAVRTTSCIRGIRITSKQMTGDHKNKIWNSMGIVPWYIPLKFIRLTGRLMDTSNLLTEAEKQAKKDNINWICTATKFFLFCY